MDYFVDIYSWKFVGQMQIIASENYLRPCATRSMRGRTEAKLRARVGAKKPSGGVLLVSLSSLTALLVHLH